jgi:dTDP-glucose 4,6-dehydratase
MHILIYGSKGWIGKQFVDYLSKQNVKYTVGVERCENIKNLKAEITGINPTNVVSFIGRTHGRIGEKVYTTIDYLEQKGKVKENVRDNLFSPMVLSHICKLNNIHYAYLGTGCIFKFDKEHPYEMEINGFTEESEPNFFGSGYSTVKGFTDQLMSFYQDSVLNLRIRMPITGGKSPRNFITKITTYEKICSIKNSMTVLPEMMPIIFDMMKNKTTGTMNLTNPGLISHNEILSLYKEIVDPSFEWKNFTAEEQSKILASDRSNNFLDTTKLESMYKVKNIKESVRDMLIEYKKDLSSYYKLDGVVVNLLITGGCGFIGSNFINYFFKTRKMNKLVNLDAMYYSADENNVEESIRNDYRYEFIEGNCADEELVRSIYSKYKITHVIHFAAQSHVQTSFNSSLQYTKDNIVGTHVLLEEGRKYNKLSKFVHVSTDEVYGESMNETKEKQKTEYSILCPTNPYAGTKAGAELIAQSYNHSFKMPIIISRGNNVYGPNQYPEKLIPRFIKLLKENKKVTIQGKGTAVRGFLHAMDTAKAFECILEKGRLGEIYNIGCDDNMEYSVMEIAKILIKKMKKTENYDDWIEYIEDRPFNDQRYYISNKKMRELGWDVKIYLEEGLNNLLKNN